MVRSWPRPTSSDSAASGPMLSGPTGVRSGATCPAVNRVRTTGPSWPQSAVGCEDSAVGLPLNTIPRATNRDAFLTPLGGSAPRRDGLLMAMESV